MISDQLKQAIQLIRSGKKMEARQILKRVLVNDPTNDTAWLWFVDTLPTDEDRCIALEGLQKINPESKVARIGLAEYRRKQQQKAEHLHPHPSPAQTPLIPDAELTTNSEEVLQNPPFPVESMEELETESLPVDLYSPPPIFEDVDQVDVIREAYPTPSKKLAAPVRFLISGVFVLLLLLIVAVFLANYGWADKYPVLKIFAPASQSTCSCPDANAYLLRVSNRIQSWKTSQALAIFQAAGKKPVDVDFAHNLYSEEQAEKPPICMKTAHDLTLSLLENNSYFVQQLQANNITSAANYKSIVDDYQSQLADEFSRINKGYSCQ
jgi:hypothetical protein